MNMLIIDGPDNVGKSAAITSLTDFYTGEGLDVCALRFPNRADMSFDLMQYAMSASAATPLERQFYIWMNSIMQYGKIPAGTDLVICDRHPLIAMWAYFDDISDSAWKYRCAAREITRRLGEIHHIRDTAVVLLNGQHHFGEPNPDEHFEQGWKEKSDRYHKMASADDVSRFIGMPIGWVDVNICPREEIVPTIDKIYQSIVGKKLVGEWAGTAKDPAF